MRDVVRKKSVLSESKLTQSIFIGMGIFFLAEEVTFGGFFSGVRNSYYDRNINNQALKQQNAQKAALAAQQRATALKLQQAARQKQIDAIKAKQAKLVTTHADPKIQAAALKANAKLNKGSNKEIAKLQRLNNKDLKQQTKSEGIVTRGTAKNIHYAQKQQILTDRKNKAYKGGFTETHAQNITSRGAQANTKLAQDMAKAQKDATRAYQEKVAASRAGKAPTPTNYSEYKNLSKSERQAYRASSDPNRVSVLQGRAEARAQRTAQARDAYKAAKTNPTATRAEVESLRDAYKGAGPNSARSKQNAADADVTAATPAKTPAPAPRSYAEYKALDKADRKVALSKSSEADQLKILQEKSQARSDALAKADKSTMTNADYKKLEAKAAKAEDTAKIAGATDQAKYSALTDAQKKAFIAKAPEDSKKLKVLEDDHKALDAKAVNAENAAKAALAKAGKADPALDKAAADARTAANSAKATFEGAQNTAIGKKVDNTTDHAAYSALSATEKKAFVERAGTDKSKLGILEEEHDNKLRAYNADKADPAKKTAYDSAKKDFDDAKGAEAKAAADAKALAAKAASDKLDAVKNGKDLKTLTADEKRDFAAAASKDPAKLKILEDDMKRRNDKYAVAQENVKTIGKTKDVEALQSKTDKATAAYERLKLADPAKAAAYKDVAIASAQKDYAKLPDADKANFAKSAVNDPTKLEVLQRDRDLSAASAAAAKKAADAAPANADLQSKAVVEAKKAADSDAIYSNSSNNAAAAKVTDAAGFKALGKGSGAREAFLEQAKSDTNKQKILQDRYNDKVAKAATGTPAEKAKRETRAIEARKKLAETLPTGGKLKDASGVEHIKNADGSFTPPLP